VRGGLDDALDKLARRDELRRRAAGEATGTPPAVQELAEAIASVVSRNPNLGVTVGVEGAGDPVLLHFSVEDGVVQVNVDNSVASRVADAAPASPKHADFDIDVDESDSAFVSAPAYPGEVGQETRRISYDDSNRYGPGTGYSTSAYADEPVAATTDFADPPYADPVDTDRRYDRHRRYDDDFTAPDFFPEQGRGAASRESAFPTADTSAPAPHPFAATPPPPVPPQTPRRIRAEQHRAPEEPSAAQRAASQHPHTVPNTPPAQRGMPTPLPKPIPLKVNSEETELAAKRLAALLRDNPSLLHQAPPD
jgi:hypothetical protein